MTITCCTNPKCGKPIFPSMPTSERKHSGELLKAGLWPLRCKYCGFLQAARDLPIPEPYQRITAALRRKVALQQEALSTELILREIKSEIEGAV